MDSTTFRWVLVVIAVLLGVAIYLYGQYQSRLRRRNAMESFTREEIDSAFIEDEQLRSELDSLSEVLLQPDDDAVDELQINVERDDPTTPFSLPDPELHVPRELRDRDDSEYISYLLRHEDFRLITGGEAGLAMHQAGLQPGDDGYLEYREDDALLFRIASLSPPGSLSEVEQLDFSTIGFNYFIDLEDCAEPRQAYEVMLRKIDELVRELNVKVYKSTHELLTISDVTAVRKSLS